MRILFDQGTPAPPRQHLGDHEVDTVAERGWSELGNGDLIARAEDEGYDVLVTTDQNMRCQQTLTAIGSFEHDLQPNPWASASLKLTYVGGGLHRYRSGLGPELVRC